MGNFSTRKKPETSNSTVRLWLAHQLFGWQCLEKDSGEHKHRVCTGDLPLGTAQEHEKVSIKASHWYPNCSNKIDKLRSHNGMLSVALAKGTNVDRDEWGWKIMRLKIHAGKTKANTILEKWPVGGSRWILAPTSLFCIPKDQKEPSPRSPEQRRVVSLYHQPQIS